MGPQWPPKTQDTSFSVGKAEDWSRRLWPVLRGLRGATLGAMHVNVMGRVSSLVTEVSSNTELPEELKKSWLEVL